MVVLPAGVSCRVKVDVALVAIVSDVGVAVIVVAAWAGGTSTASEAATTARTAPTAIRRFAFLNMADSRPQASDRGSDSYEESDRNTFQM
jgi:hypothetical protein